jgi:hypothetical protein
MRCIFSKIITITKLKKQKKEKQSKKKKEKRKRKKRKHLIAQLIMEYIDEFQKKK